MFSLVLSCYGEVTSLNGEPEPGVFVEALGKDSCSMYQEESKTEQNGKYRIRGLQVKCYACIYFLDVQDNLNVCDCILPLTKGMLLMLKLNDSRSVVVLKACKLILHAS